MIYFIFACFCVFFAFSWLNLREVGKHDDVLFPFCQLRREVMKYRYEAVMKMHGAYSREESESLRRLSRALDATIRNYNGHKVVMFNLRAIIKYIEQYRDTAEKVAPLELTDNPQIREFHAKFALCLAKAFLKYTPLIRSELALRLIARAYRLGYDKGKKSAVEYVVKNVERARNDERHYGSLVGEMAAA